LLKGKLGTRAKKAPVTGKGSYLYIGGERFYGIQRALLKIV
jgi:hypothetical protein